MSKRETGIEHEQNGDVQICECSSERNQDRERVGVIGPFWCLTFVMVHGQLVEIIGSASISQK